MDEAKNKLSEIKIKISDIQEDKKLSNTEKENNFADYIKGIDNESIKQAAQDFDILKGSVDKFSEESLVNLYASQIKNTQGFVGVRSAIASYNDACKKGEEESNLVAKAIGKTNTSLGDHLTACNGAKTSMAKYVGSLVKTRGQQLLLQASTAALNMGLTMVVSAGISLLINGLSELYVSSEEAAEKAEELKSKYEETTTALKDNLKTVEGFSDEFRKLVKGVDENGNNIGLTTDQYSRYKEIVEQLVGINPDLVKGYDDENNAIIKKNGAIESTIRLLKEQQRLETKKITSDSSLETLTEGLEESVNKIKDQEKEIKNDFTDNINDYLSMFRGMTGIEQKSEWAYDTSNGLPYNFRLETKNTLLPLLDKNWDNDTVVSDFIDKYNEIESRIPNLEKSSTGDFSEFISSINEAIDLAEKYGNINEDTINKLRAELYGLSTDMGSVFDEYLQNNSEFDEKSKELNSTLKQIPQSMTEYDKLSKGQKAFVDSFIDDFKITLNLDDTDKWVEEVQKKADDIRDLVKNMPNDAVLTAGINLAFDIDTSKVSVEGYQKKISEAAKIIHESATNKDKDGNYIKSEDEIKLMISFGFETDIDDLKENVTNRLKEAFNIDEKDITSKLDKLTVEEFENLANVDFSQYKTLDDAITHAVKEAHKFDLSSYKDDIDNVQDRISKLSSALEKLKSGELSDAERIDLAQEFTDLTPYINDTEKLQQAIQKLIQTEPNDLISDLEDLKKNLKTEEEVEQVDNLIKVLEKLGIVSSKTDKTAGKTGEELANEYLELQEDKIDKIIDKIEDKKEAEEKVLNSMQKQKDAMEEQLEILQKEKEEIEEKEETISKKVSEYETAGNTAISFLDDKIQELNDAKDALEKSYDDEIKNTQDKYNDEIDALKEKNDAINRSIELKKAEDELYNARNTKVRVYSEAGGFEEQVNASAVREKEQNLSSLKRGYKIEDLESERDKAVKKIETDKENDPRLAQYEKDIKAYEDYKKSFEDMVNSYERNQNNLTAARILGANWHEQVTNKDIGIIQKYGSEYNSYQKQLNEDIPKEIEAKENAIEEQEKVIENQDKAIQKQQEVIDSHDEEIQSWNEYKDDLKGAVEEIGKTNDEYVTSLDNVVLSEKSSYEDRVREAKKFKQTIIGILGSNDTNEVNGLADDYLNSDDSKTSSKKSSKKSEKKSEKKYELYYTDSEGKKHTLDTFSNNISAINYKMDMIEDYADRYVGHAKSLNKRFGIKLSNDANEYGIRQALSNAIKIKAYAKGGINDFTGLAMMHGTKQKSEVVFNSADAKKLYDFVHTSNNLPEMLMNNVSNSIAKMFSEITTKMGQNTEFNSNSSSKSTSITIQINNPNIQADNYEQFERCMSQYITKQKLDTWVGK